MLSKFKLMNMIISLFIRIFFIFHDLMIFYKNFMILAYQENNLVRHEMNYYFKMHLCIQKIL